MLRRVAWVCDLQPIFLRYLLPRTIDMQGIASIRSIIGAIRLTRFGVQTPATISKAVDALRRLADDTSEPPHSLQASGRVRIDAGLLAGLKALVIGSPQRGVEILFNLLGREACASVCVDPVGVVSGLIRVS